MTPARWAIGRSGLRMVAILALAGCATGKPPAISFLTPLGKPLGPFSHAVQVGDMLYLAGQIGTDSTGSLVKGGIGPETRQTMKNIETVLNRTGSSLGRVVKCTAFLADMAEWPAMNVIYTEFFPVNKPARSALGANGLALNARVEIECIAVVAR